MGLIPLMRHISALDDRSLALLRVGLGLVLLYNLYDCWLHVDALMGPAGVWPLAEYARHHDMAAHFSLYAVTDGKLGLGILFTAHACCALMLVLGWRTRLASILCWVMTIFLFRRIEPFVFSGDRALAAFLMWGMFLPLGRRLSLDAYFRRQPLEGHRIVSIAGLALVMQLAVIYIIAACAKFHPIWMKDHTALNLLFHNPNWAKPLAAQLTAYPQFLQALTILVPTVELGGMALLLCPVPLVRSLLIVVFALFHVFIFLTIDVSWFSWVMIAAWTALIPASWWPAKEAGKEIRNHVWAERLAAVLLIFVLGWQALKLNAIVVERRPWAWAEFGPSSAMGVYQNWVMFAPHPPLVQMAYYVTNRTTTMLWPQLAQKKGFDGIDSGRWRKYLYVHPPMDLSGLNRYINFRWQQVNGGSQQENWQVYRKEEGIIF